MKFSHLHDVEWVFRQGSRHEHELRHWRTPAGEPNKYGITCAYIEETALATAHANVLGYFYEKLLAGDNPDLIREVRCEPQFAFHVLRELVTEQKDKPGPGLRFGEKSLELGVAVVRRAEIEIDFIERPRLSSPPPMLRLDLDR